MSTFDETKHDRDHGGKFTTKEHGVVDVDLDGNADDSPEVCDWDEIDETLLEALQENIKTQTANGYPSISGSTISVLDHLGCDQAAAEQTWGSGRARWLAAVQVDVGFDYEPSDAVVTFEYVDPASGKRTYLGESRWTSGEGMHHRPTITDEAPFDTNGDILAHQTPDQFLSENWPDLAPWHVAGITTGYIRTWQGVGIEADEAVRWRDEMGLGPTGAAAERQLHGNVEGALAHREYVTASETQREAKDAMDHNGSLFGQALHQAHRKGVEADRLEARRNLTAYEQETATKLRHEVADHRRDITKFVSQGVKLREAHDKARIEAVNRHMHYHQIRGDHS